MFSRASKTSQFGIMGEGAKSGLKAGVPSIISADLRITGDLVCSGDIQIDGWIEGDIQSRNITVGEGATVQGALQAETVRICGLVNGEVRADTVVLEKNARVTGDILHKSLAIEQGAYLEGMCRRTDAHTPVPALDAKPKDKPTPVETMLARPEKLGPTGTV